MRRDKQGKIIFDSIEESMKYMEKEYSPEKVHKRALDRKKVINFDSPMTRRNLLISVIKQLPKKDHRQLLGYLTDAGTQGIDRRRAIKHLSQEVMHMSIKRILKLEREAVDECNKIINKRVIPITVGDVIKEFSTFRNEGR